MEYYYFSEVSAAWKIKYFSGNFYVAGKNKDMNTIIGKVNEQGELLEEVVLELNRDIEEFCLKEDGSISCLMPRYIQKKGSN